MMILFILVSRLIRSLNITASSDSDVPLTPHLNHKQAKSNKKTHLGMFLEILVKTITLLFGKQIGPEAGISF